MNALKHMKILYVNDRNSDEEYGVSELQDYCNNIIVSNNSINAIEVYKQEKPEIVIYSVSFPKIKEEEFIEKIKSINEKAQVIITTKNIDKHKLYNAINFHLIKYLAYPFNMNSLLDSLKDCIKSIDSNTSNIIKLSNSLTYDRFNKSLLKNGELVSLSTKETNFFDTLVKNKDRAVSYEEFNQIIWQGEMTKDALRSIVKDLRRKIDKSIIKNVSGIGYRVDL
ncbi:DNA-binding response regulator [Malaciobacter molluscorum LMG 25693]|uniref:DNA-binding response regulator n=1 Tax=Malaciobacter molluscorum LMG 25693 TaxID=870501 RepID=A0A2G1DKJ8_9BACT|nr:winged helix-turn-helix domain-containing protein [Malaciobacter molluscorum]AXX92598.1 signal transduction response regulator, OmpR family [Malaciobacter molluscorum LMG 25693]PHO19022.1 DNA-binding response regulator [Malaciobacter molluscorum LMG 25693]RXJ97329.1 DNA-binding response regulator [Malaciobacter molluscorum]